MKAVLASEKFLRIVNPIASRTLRKCEMALKPNKNYTVSIAPTSNPFVISRMNGASGFTYSKEQIDIVVSTKAKAWRKGLEGALAHEFNHVIRIQYLGIYSLFGSKLADSIVSEGLAQLFEEEITGIRPPYSNAISEREAKSLWAKIRGYRKDDYYLKFFTNRGDKEYPLWCGYTMAYLIMRKRKKELALPWKKLMGMPTGKLIQGGL